MLFDTHAHYDDKRFDEDRDALLHSMQGMGVGYIINPGIHIESSKKAVQLAHTFPFVYAGVGIHPHEASGYEEGSLAVLEGLANDPRVVAIGEMGLDYHYDFSPRDVQKKCFIAQMELAGKLDLPVIIHEREAPADCFDIVKRFSGNGVYHCYSGSLEMAKEIIKKGYYLSFTGVVTFSNAKRILEVVKWVPLERMMIETDCPYMAPTPHRGKRNHSGYVNLVAEKIAEVRGMDVEQVVEVTRQNAMELFLKKGEKA